MRQKVVPSGWRGISIILVIIFLAIVGVAAYFIYKNFLPQLNQVIPTPAPTTGATPNSEIPIVTIPQSGTKIASPLTVQGIVPPGWMFEGTFPIKLVDSNKNIIVTGQAKEEVAGSWQSNVPVNFSATLNFSTTTKSGFIILMNDNPSGDPSKARMFEVPVVF